MKDRVGEVYEWTLNDDIVVIVKKHQHASNPDIVVWEARSLLTAHASWFLESWFNEKSGEYLHRIA